MDFASEVGKMIHTMTQYEVRETTLYHIILSLLWITSPIRCSFTLQRIASTNLYFGIEDANALVMLIQEIVLQIIVHIHLVLW